MISPMKKVSLVCMKSAREDVLSALQECGLVMLDEAPDGNNILTDAVSTNERNLDLLLKELAPYSKKKSFLEGKPEVEINDFKKFNDSPLREAEELTKLLSKIESLEKGIKKDTEILEALTKWKSLDTPVEKLGRGKYITLLPGKVSKTGFEAVKNAGADISVIEESEKEILLIVAFSNDDEKEVLSGIRLQGFEEMTFPFKAGKVADECERLTQKLKENKTSLEESKKILSEKTESNYDSFSLCYEQYKAKKELLEIRLGESEETVFITGFAREDSKDKITEAVSKVTDAFDIFFDDPTDEDDVPTSLTNSKLVSQFEGITEMFNPPVYGDIDPNPVMAPWYWLIFGMMMGDAGYGVMLLIFTLLFRVLLKPKGGTLKLVNVMLYSSIPTIFFGILFGSYFGEELVKPIVGFTAMSDPIKMLIFTLVVGVLHIFTGMITKIVMNIKSGHLLDAIFDQVSWMMIIAGAGMIFLPGMKNIGIIIAVAGAVIVLCTAGRAKKGIIGKITGGLTGLYGITSYFSDILSYSRILALGLSTGVVGFVMNMLAGMVRDGMGGVIGFILSLLIYIVGHIFNLALGLLSAYVHDCRLQYIEFYGKFYEGGGRIFRPFGIKTSYIEIKKNNK